MSTSVITTSKYSSIITKVCSGGKSFKALREEFLQKEKLIKEKKEQLRKKILNKFNDTFGFNSKRYEKICVFQKSYINCLDLSVTQIVKMMPQNKYGPREVTPLLKFWELVEDLTPRLRNCGVKTKLVINEFSPINFVNGNFVDNIFKYLINKYCNNSPKTLKMASSAINTTKCILDRAEHRSRNYCKKRADYLAEESEHHKFSKRFVKANRNFKNLSAEDKDLFILSLIDTYKKRNEKDYDLGAEVYLEFLNKYKLRHPNSSTSIIDEVYEKYFNDLLKENDEIEEPILKLDVGINGLPDLILKNGRTIEIKHSNSLEPHQVAQLLLYEVIRCMKSTNPRRLICGEILLTARGFKYNFKLSLEESDKIIIAAINCFEYLCNK